jgi:hypothetical protein
VRLFVCLSACLAVLGSGCGTVNPQGTNVPVTTTTTTTTSTSTIPNVSVPDAVDAANTLGSVTAEQQLREAGFIPKALYVATSRSCYVQNALNGNPEWKAGMAIAQDPVAGTVTPRGITVTIDFCAATPGDPTP